MLHRLLQWNLFSNLLLLIYKKRETKFGHLYRMALIQTVLTKRWGVERESENTVGMKFVTQLAVIGRGNLSWTTKEIIYLHSFTIILLWICAHFQLTLAHRHGHSMGLHVKTLAISVSEKYNPMITCHKRLILQCYLPCEDFKKRQKFTVNKNSNY